MKTGRLPAILLILEQPDHDRYFIAMIFQMTFDFGPKFFKDR